jgi:predicted ferric reductase
MVLKDDEKEAVHPIVVRIQNYFAREGTKVLFMFIWLVGNLVMFFVTYRKYRSVRFDLFKLLGFGVVIARSCGACLRLNCMLILLPVLRNVMCYIRSLPIGDYLPLDKNIVFHKRIAAAIAFFAAGHTVAHCFNAMNLSRYSLSEISITIPRLSTNKIKLSDPPKVYEVAYLLLPTSTGFLLLIIMMLLYSGAWKKLRNSNFENFWYSHHLFIPFFGLLLGHGAQNLLEKTTFYFYFIIPGTLYTIERLIRFKRSRTVVTLLKVRKHAGDVLEVQMRTPTIYKAGQFAFFNVPIVSNWEWHPFTISSAPEESFLSCHMKCVGDFTKSVARLFNPKGLDEVVINQAYSAEGKRLICVDGGFGAPSEDYSRFGAVMLVGAGIGVTPFSSILKSIGYNLQRSQDNSLLKHVSFFWIMREKKGFEWFAETLRTLEAVNKHGILQIHNYMTGQLNPEEIRKVMYSEEREDPLTGLKDNPTHFGRPNWDEIFKGMAETFRGQTIGVFFCGPAVLSKQLYAFSRKYSTATTRFAYHKENM